MTAPAADLIPTLRPIADGALRVLRRFPFVITAGLVAAAAAILLIEEWPADRLTDRLLVGATLGLPLLTATRVAGERHGLNRRAQVLVGLFGVGLLVAVAARWHAWSDPVRLARYVQLSTAFHLLVAIAPIGTRREPQGFWQYNRLLFERFLVAALYTVVLFGGLALALGALDRLFDVDVPGGAYARLWVTLAFVVNTWVFLAGVPEDVGRLDARTDYPPGLKVFAQYILIPIVAVYLIILTAYLAKVLVTWEWPSGWIGWLVSSVAVVGILALLLVHPVAREAENRWVAAYARGFFAALLPSVVMLWLAIGQRVAQYGITERRYFLMILSLWLGAIAVHQLVTRSRAVAVIPATLCALALITVAGPWGAYRVSERSQVRRLGRLLERHGMLDGDRAQAAARPVPVEDRREIGAVVRYLAETHGTGAIAPWFGGEEALARVDTVARGTAPSGDGEERARIIVEWLGLEYEGWAPGRYLWFSYTAEPGGATSVAGFDSLLVVRYPADSTARPGLRALGGPFGRSLRVLADGEPITVFPVDSLLIRLRERGLPPYGQEVPAGQLRLDRDAPGMRLSLQLHRIDGQWDHDTLVVREFTGVLLVGRR